MNIPQGGDITAIRDWSRRYFYTKDDVSGFFTKLNSGLKAYKLNIVANLPNLSITITDNDLTNPQSYTITTYSDCQYSGLFFFNDSCTLTLTSAIGTVVAYTPSSYDNNSIYMDVVPVNFAQSFSYIKQSSMGVSLTSTIAETTYSSGVNIGCAIYSTNPIDFTDINRMQYYLMLGNCYDGSQASDAFKYAIGLVQTLPSGYVQTPQINYECSKQYKDPNMSYIDETIDTSGITGNYYIYCNAPGWTSELSDLLLF